MDDLSDVLFGLVFAVGFAGLLALIMYLGLRAERRREERAAPDVLDAVDGVLTTLGGFLPPGRRCRRHDHEH